MVCIYFETVKVFRHKSYALSLARDAPLTEYTYFMSV